MSLHVKSIDNNTNISFYLFIYPVDSQESDRVAIHRANNYPDLLPEMLKYCGLVKILYLILFIFSFIEI